MNPTVHLQLLLARLTDWVCRQLISLMQYLVEENRRLSVELAAAPQPQGSIQVTHRPGGILNSDHRRTA
jgi:hypothetical protein